VAADAAMTLIAPAIRDEFFGAVFSVLAFDIEVQAITLAK
jgi:hypothetical protein